MKHPFLLCILLSSPALLAETFKSKIHSIEGNIVKFENGRVAFLDEMSPLQKTNLFLKVDADALVTDESQRPVFEPTVVPDLKEAWNIFNRSNPNYKRVSECSDRAHVWANDEFTKTGTKSLKAFVFFTNSYINSVRFKWWFHVAPMYKVNVNGKIQDLVMDFRYTDRPASVKEWTDQFVYTKRPCKVTNRFSEYELNPETENCYLIFESMHYKLPIEIHDQELKGRYKTATSENEVKDSFRNAFEI